MDEKTEADTKPKEKRVDLSLAQVAGSALAAAVAAFLAGQLGVYGTIIGAGVVSVVATTGGSIFQHLFRRTGEQIKEAAVTTRPKPHRVSTSRSRSTTRSQTTTSTPGSADATKVLPTFDKQGTQDPVTSVAAREPNPATARTQLIPRAQQQPPGRDLDATQLVARPAERTMALGRAAARDADETTVLPQAGGPGCPESGVVPHDTEEATATYGTRLRGWKRPALGALAVFVLAMGAVTATELLTGQSASGNPGTTLSNITSGNFSPQRHSTPQAPEPGHSTGSGTDRHGGSQSPDPNRSGGTGSDGADSGTGRGGQSPTPTPSDGASGSPSPGTSSSPDPSPSQSAGTDGGKDGGGSGSTGGGATPGHQQSDKPSGGQTPDPNTP
ncbi:hypothetical protein ACIQU6_42220 [Streptomyces sp. NPDC090442]|uniref:hypothetical protein n=1 Tax=Streptomyces sp. NPDC090442 TaxID=3365962 RepID=UPI00382ED90B